MRYNVGDIVRITKCIRGHFFNIGSKVRITNVLDEEDEGGYYARDINNTGSFWWITDEEIDSPILSINIKVL
jgi:hypothetical protein